MKEYEADECRNCSGSCVSLNGEDLKRFMEDKPKEAIIKCKNCGEVYKYLNV